MSDRARTARSAQIIWHISIYCIYVIRRPTSDDRRPTPRMPEQNKNLCCDLALRCRARAGFSSASRVNCDRDHIETCPCAARAPLGPSAICINFSSESEAGSSMKLKLAITCHVVELRGGANLARAPRMKPQNPDAVKDKV